MSAPRNTVVHGNCIDVMCEMPEQSVDFVLTDPPYVACYKSRDNQTIRNDDNAAWLWPAFAHLHRVLKDDSFALGCVAKRSGASGRLKS